MTVFGSDVFRLDVILNAYARLIALVHTPHGGVICVVNSNVDHFSSIVHTGAWLGLLFIQDVQKIQFCYTFRQTWAVF